MAIPLFIYTQRATLRSRDKSRAVHSAIATIVVNHSLRSNREFRIGILQQYFLSVFIINSICNLKLFFSIKLFYAILSYSLLNGGSQ